MTSSIRIALLAGAMLLPATTVVGVRDAAAASVVELSLDQLVDAADIVVRAEVAQIWTEKDERGRVWTRAQLSVDSVLKGESPTELVLDQVGGEWAGHATRSQAMTQLSEGEVAYFFLEQNGSGLWLMTGAFQGKYTVRLDPRSRQDIVQRFFAPQGKTYDHRFLPLPDTTDRVFATDFEQTVLDRVESGWDGQPIPGASMERLYRANRVSEVTQ